MLINFKPFLSFSIMNQWFHHIGSIRNLFPALQEIKLNDQQAFLDWEISVQIFDQLTGGCHRPSGGQEIVHYHDPRTRLDCIALNLNSGAAVLQRVGGLHTGARKLAGFANLKSKNIWITCDKLKVLLSTNMKVKATTFVSWIGSIFKYPYSHFPIDCDNWMTPCFWISTEI